MPRGPIRVAIVDDEPAVRTALARLLEASSFETVTYGSAREFIDSMRRGLPECLIVDVHMPEFSGLDLQRQLANTETELPIIFLTGHGDIPMSVRAMKAGAVEFLTKPFNDEVLLEAIRAAIEHSRAALAAGAEERLAERMPRVHGSSPALAPRFETMIREAPIAPVVHDLNLRVLSPKVRGWVQPQSWWGDFRSVWMKD